MSIGHLKNNGARFILSLALMLNTGFVFAGSKPAPAPAPSKQDGGPDVTLEVNPQALQDLLLKRNLNIELELQNLYTAKANVSLAQTHLMPSLNLNLGAALNPISFAISTISFLVPFLIPSNWLLLDEANDQYKAEGVGYYITKLDNLASVDAMYYTLVSNVDTYNAVLEQQQMAEETLSLVQANYNLGIAILADLKQAQENYDQAKARVATAQLSIEQENLAILQLVNMDPETNIKVDMQHETPSVLEGKTIDQIADLTIEKSPEWLQANYMIAASQENIKATEWSWINTGTLSSAGGASGESATLSKMQAGIAFQIGPAIIPSVKLADLQKDIAQTQQVQIKNSQQFAIGTTVKSLTVDLAELEYYQDAEDSSREVYNTYLGKYKLGSTDLLHVFTAQTDLITQEMNRIVSQSNVDNQRVALKRIDREESFAQIKQCNLDNLGNAHRGWFKKVGGIFSSPKLLVDQACANTQQAPGISSGKKGK